VSAPEEPGALGLPPRPGVPPELLAVIAAAAAAALAPPAAAGPTDGTELAWRFSGRWWQGPTALRRERPWARR
jgi:hypothetical protein